MGHTYSLHASSIILRVNGLSNGQQKYRCGYNHEF